MNSGWLAWECIVFTIFIFASSVAPLWRRRKDAAVGGSAKRAYIFAGGGVSTLAMILSVARGTLGVRSFLGFPSELVYYGSAMWETLYGIIIAFPIVCLVFIPVYYRLHTNSVYEYLQMRFHCTWVRRIAAATFLIRQLLNLAVTVYTPTVALHAVLAMPHWASAAALTAVAIVFNLLGGLAAAIRADVIQTLTMIVVSAAFIIQATLKAGGPQQVLTDNIEGGRMKFFQFTWDPTVRVDTLSAIIGQLFMSISIYGCQQTFVQRYCSMSSEARVRRTLFANVPAVAVLFSLSWVVGMALYSVYKHCDPLASGAISAPDEVLPFYVEDQFGFLPGMLGLFLGSLFNGALSFLVSNVNSLATVTWEDFVSAVPYFKGINDTQQLTVIKIIGVIYSIVIMCLSLCVGVVGGVVEGSLLVTSATSGALLGVFTLAALCPLANSKGALWGMVASHVITTWMAAGRLIYVNNRVEMLPVSTEGCANATLNVFNQKALLPARVNQTLMSLAPFLQNINVTEITEPMDSFHSSHLYKMYAISYMWYAVIGTITCIVVGNVIGAITGNEKDKFDEMLLHPFIAKIYRKIPGSKRTFRNEKSENEKESSVKTEVTVADDAKNTEVNNITEVKNAVSNSNKVVSSVCNQANKIKTQGDDVAKVKNAVSNSNKVVSSVCNQANKIKTQGDDVAKVKNAVSNSNKVVSSVCNQANKIKTQGDDVAKVKNVPTSTKPELNHRLQNETNTSCRNSENINNADKLHDSTSSRLFDAYIVQQSPTPTRTRL